MKNIKITKETIALIFITILSAVLNLGNISIEGTGNAYYAAAVKSMTMSLKNFFFVSFDPSGFVTIDKPPLGYWLQAISAKIFGFYGWSIMLPQALAGVISIVVIYHIVKRAFGKGAGLISALCLAVTPVFVAASRNNTVDNVLVLVLLLACWVLSIAAEKGKFRYLVLSMILVGLGFNIKMLQAYMVVPALYITYLFATGTSLKKRIVHLVAATFVLVAVSLSWALVVDAVPASSRPYIDSSTNNTVMELILGHNGVERLSLGSNQNNGGGAPGGNMPGGPGGGIQDSIGGAPGEGMQGSSGNASGEGIPSNPGIAPGEGMQEGPGDGPANGIQDGQGGGPGGMKGGQHGGPGGGPSGLQGSFGGQLKAGITRLFSKNILSDQIVWFILLAVFGFIASAIKEKLNFKLDNKRKQSLVLWLMWFSRVFIYFSFNTGTFHSYYLTMLAPPVAALAGIGVTCMWEFYKEDGWKSWFLPAALFSTGAVQLLMLTYFMTTSSVVTVLLVLLVILCFGSASILSVLNFKRKGENVEKKNIIRLKKILACLAVAGLLVTPLAGSGATMFTGVGGSFPAAGLELLANTQVQGDNIGRMPGSSDSGMTDFLLKNKTSSQKYLLVVSSANSAAEIIVKTGEPVMAIGGFLGNDKSITLDQFIELVKKGEVRYVMADGNKGGGNAGESSYASQIMNWVKEHGTAVSASEYKSNSASENFGGNGSLYDLKPYTDNLAKS
jgi:4-amino-4-deoxy-L-arabinose transferase-like glycosyltransferase